MENPEKKSNSRVIPPDVPKDQQSRPRSKPNPSKTNEFVTETRHTPSITHAFENRGGLDEPSGIAIVKDEARRMD